MNRKFLISFIGIILCLNFSLAEDVSVYRGQYYNDGKFLKGTFNFDFSVYDSREGGNLVYNESRIITTGDFGEWYVELKGIGQNARDANKSYYMEISVDGVIQGKRRLLTQFDFVRKDSYREDIDAILNVKNQAYFSDLNVAGKKVCLEDGTNCLDSGIWNEDFNSTFDSRDKNNKYINGSGISLVGNVFSLVGEFFSGSWKDLVDIPEGFADGVDNDTWLSDEDISKMGYVKSYNDLLDKPNFTDSHLSEKEVDDYVSNNGYISKYDAGDFFGGFDKDKYYNKNEVNALLSNLESSSGKELEVGDVFFVYSLASFKIRKKWDDVVWDKKVLVDDVYSIDKENKEIRVAEDGLYDITFECTADVSGRYRYHIDWRMVVNGKEEPGTRAASYHRIKSDGRSSVSVSLLKKFESGDSFKFQGISDHNNEVFSVPNGCRLKIIKLIREKKVSKEFISLIEPDEKKVGDMYFDSFAQELKFYDGNEWKVLEFRGENVREMKKKDIEIKTKVKDVSKAKIKDVSKAKKPEKNEVDVVSFDNKSNTSDLDKARVDDSDKENVELNITIKDEDSEKCEDVCEDVCSTKEVCENVCEDVENCKPKCETDETGMENCEDVCENEKVCKDDCKDVEVCDKVCKNDCKPPKELFDIRMDLEETVLTSANNLIAIVNYESFGSVPTPVSLKFEIFDADGQLVYSRDDDIIVTTEEVRRYSFKDLVLKEGDYEFVFTTLYNVDVGDEFRAKFVVAKKGFFSRVWGWVRFWD